MNLQVCRFGWWWCINWSRFDRRRRARGNIWRMVGQKESDRIRIWFHYGCRSFRDSFRMAGGQPLTAGQPLVTGNWPLATFTDHWLNLLAIGYIYWPLAKLTDHLMTMKNSAGKLMAFGRRKKFDSSFVLKFVSIRVGWSIDFSRQKKSQNFPHRKKNFRIFCLVPKFFWFLKKIPEWMNEWKKFWNF